MKTALLLSALLLLLTLPARAEVIVGGVAELGYLRGPKWPAEAQDSRTSLLGGIYLGTSGLELRPQALIAEGQYKGLVLDAGVRLTPKWFGQQEYIMGILSPYGVLGGSFSYSASGDTGWGWHARAGVGIAIPPYGIVNTELGWRSHRLSSTLLLEGVTLSVRAGLPF
jgi:hypothetical protein